MSVNVQDNYGARWVKQTIRWFKDMTILGCPKDELIRLSFLDNGLRKNKTTEFINELIDLNLIKLRGDKIYWCDNTPEKPLIQPYLTAKKELEDNDISSEDALKEMYQLYVKNCEKDGEKPLTINQWKDKENQI